MHGNEDPDGSDAGRAIPVANAGLVLAWPFLPRLFEMLGLVSPRTDTERGWVDPEAQARAVRLLHHLATGDIDAPEPALSLSKLLAGLSPADPAPPAGALAPTETDACNQLLDAMRAHWPPLRYSSNDGLRETFLQRGGHLAQDGKVWLLEVELKTIDALLHQLPWSFSSIRHDWMQGGLSVRWP